MPRAPLRFQSWFAGLLALLGCGGADPGLALSDLDGRTVTLLPAAGPGASVFIFVGADCPISNRYAPEIARLRERYSPGAAGFWIVYPGTRFPAAELRKHRDDWLPGCAALSDPDLRLARTLRVRVTPEAVVITPARGLVYRGRIDDQFADFGVQRAAPASRELQQALDAVAQGKPPSIASAPAVGCPISN
jgi:hypothetical protein